jgi:hypothetical protein
LARFALGLHDIYSSIEKGKQVSFNGNKLVLLDELVTPQSFLNWIFLNKADYESGKIEKDILEHELTHIRQKHSLDVILIELLRIMFWFNPFIYGYRHSIMLNHEFLADEHVVTHVSEKKKYQETLLEFATSETNAKFVNT